MFFRAVSRAVTSSARNSTRTAVYARQFSQQQIRCAAASEHAIANPELAGIEKRWDVMPPQEQAELWMKLRDRMKVNWKDMTLAEKKAGACTRNSKNSTSKLSPPSIRGQFVFLSISP